MKTINTTLLFALLAIFTSISSNAAARDCSGLKPLSHKYLMCIAGSDKYGEATVKEKKQKKEKKAKKEKKKFKKIKIGENAPKTLVDLIKKINPNEKK